VLQTRRGIENTSADGIRVTSSFGVDVGSDGVEQVLAEADARLYTAKQSGRNCVIGPVLTVGPAAAA
jgi:GGDEF domain-containing protein